jgi:hypothetical protein
MLTGEFREISGFTKCKEMLRKEINLKGMVHIICRFDFDEISARFIILFIFNE